MSGSPAYKPMVLNRLPSARCAYSRTEWVVWHTAGNSQQRVGTGFTANEAWKNAWLAIRARELARGAPRPASDAGPSVALTIRVPKGTLDAVKRHCTASGMSLQDYTVELYCHALGITL